MSRDNDRAVWPRKRAARASDPSLLRQQGAMVEVLCDGGSGVRSRWRGEILRAATGTRRSIEILPLGCSSSLEILESQIYEALPWTEPETSHMGRTVAALQRARMGERR